MADILVRLIFHTIAQTRSSSLGLLFRQHCTCETTHRQQPPRSCCDISISLSPEFGDTYNKARTVTPLLMFISLWFACNIQSWVFDRPGLCLSVSSPGEYFACRIGLV